MGDETTFSTSIPTCRWCGPGVMHSGMCPKVKSIEYYPNGAIKRVELREGQNG